MIKFRIFCELLAKMMLESIDFTDVSEDTVEMKSPRDRALQRFFICSILSFEL